MLNVPSEEGPGQGPTISLRAIPMVASRTIAEWDVRSLLPTQSVFTRKAARRWQMRERLTRMPVWNTGLLLNNFDGGARFARGFLNHQRQAE